MSKLYIKNIDGTYSPYNPVAVSNLDIVQETGDSLTSAMSQKAVTNELTKKQDTINDLADIRSGATKGATALQSETDPVYMADKPNIALKTEIPNISNLATKEEVAAKQDTIPDLISIRDGASKGATALQAESDPVYLADKPKLALKTEIPDVSGKVDKEAGKGLSSNDYTDAEKAKLAGLENYDDTQIKTLIDGKQNVIDDLTTIRSGASKGATALQSYTESDPVYIADKPKIALKSEIPDISELATKEEVAGKQDTISDLASIKAGAAKGATALQSYTETDPIYMADKPSIALKNEIPDVSGKADKTLIVTETEGNASYSIAPNKLIKLGTLASSVTLSLNSASEEAGVANIYDFIFTTPTDAPSIT